MQKLRCIFPGLILSLLLTACYKEVKLTGNQYRIEPVVNCLFNTDSIWKVNVSLGKSPDKSTVEYIDKAIVIISTAGGWEEQLVYTDKGDYTSANGIKPMAENIYTLQVTVPGYQKITATDNIPAGAQISNIIFDTSLISITPTVFSDAVKTYPVSVNITDIDRASKYYLLRPLYYDKDELKIYKVTQNTLDELRKIRRISAGDSSKLATILNEEYRGISAFKNSLTRLAASLAFNERIYKYSYFDTFSTYSPSLFLHQRAYVNDIYFRHLADDFYSVFGEKIANMSFNAYKLSLLYNFNPGGALILVNNELVKKDVEWYLEVNTLSESAYKYFTTYLQNIANRNHPFAEHVNVFSNVSNGLGIFAGMETSRIRVY